MLILNFREKRLEIVKHYGFHTHNDTKTGTLFKMQNYSFF